MKRYTYNTYYLLGILGFIAFSFLGCNKEYFSNEGKEITFRAGILSATRAPIESDEKKLPLSDIQDIQLLRGTDGEKPAFHTTSAVKAVGTLNTKGELSFFPSQTYPEDDNTKAHFIAYRPLGDTKEGSITWNIDGESDILYTTPVSASYATNGNNGVSMHFQHALTRLRIIVKATDQASVTTYRAVRFAKIKVPQTFTMTLNETGIENFSFTTNEYAELNFCKYGKLEVKCKLTEGESYPYADLLLPPDASSIKGGYLVLGFDGQGTSEENPEYHKLPTSLQLEAGKTTILTITLTGRELLFDNPIIMGWEDILIGGDKGTDITIQ